MTPGLVRHPILQFLTATTLAFGVASSVASDTSNEVPAPSPGIMAGAKCPECGAHAMIRKDGCDYCTQCGHVGACG